MFVILVSSSIGSLTNPLKLSNAFKSFDSKSTITNKTIYNYLKYLEDVIYLELKRRGFSVGVGVVEVRSNISNTQLEIDFIANKGSDKYYIQSSFNLDTKEKMKQEIRPLVNVNDFFKKIIIVKDDIVKYQNEQGIIIMGIYDFLLDENSLS